MLKFVKNCGTIWRNHNVILVQFFFFLGLVGIFRGANGENRDTILRVMTGTLLCTSSNRDTVQANRD